ncbi:hypothetical protein Q5752_006496 [Cryptotrichosporon argae]
MPVVLGFELNELSFKAFSSKRMFDRRWHLRRERFIAYQVAMLVGLAAECTATYSLAKYEDLQGLYENNYTGAHFYQNDLIDCEISTIVFCVLVACVFGADFFFLLQFPRQRYPLWYQICKKTAAVIVTLGILGSAIASTIIIARNTAVLGHISDELVAEARVRFHHPPWEYRTWSVNIAYIVQLWVAWVGCVVSTVLMFLAANWDAANGPGPVGGDTESLRGTMPASRRKLVAGDSTADLNADQAMRPIGAREV